MNPTDSTPDDSYWSSLAEELDVKPTPSPVESLLKSTEDLPDAQDHEEDTVIVPTLQDSAGDPDEDVEELIQDEQEEAAPTAPIQEGEPERKRRRRRRKRKKGSSSLESEPESSGTVPAGDDELEVEEADESVIEQGGELIPAAAEEQPAELAQEVIANWDVPSWEEIIRGLYRPGR